MSNKILTFTLFLSISLSSIINPVTANKQMIIECRYMTALSWVEGGVFGECDTASSHNNSEIYKYYTRESELSNTYVCIVTNFPSIYDANVRVEDKIGSYCDGMLDLHVKGIVFDCSIGDMKSKVMQFMPFGLENHFGEIEMLRISNCGLRKIEQSDLKPFGNLKMLQLDGNALEIIPGDLFKYNRALNMISFISNDIYSVHSNTFDGLELSALAFVGNVCVRRNFKNVDETLKQLKTNCPEGGRSPMYKTLSTIFWSIFSITLIYGIIIAVYILVMRVKYQKHVKIEFFHELTNE